MSPEDILARHLAIKEAVAWTEFFVLSDAELREGTQGRVWSGATLADIVVDFVSVIDQTLNEDDPPNRMQLLKAREQLQTSAFREYLAGRLGLL